jgi:hypothetical protein
MLAASACTMGAMQFPDGLLLLREAFVRHSSLFLVDRIDVRYGQGKNFTQSEE